MNVSAPRTLATSSLRSVHDMAFRRVHSSNLIYNTAWEDPRIDRELLGLQSDSEVVMISSAGCNALDYLLDSPARIYAIDLNHRQNAVLELKMALLAHGSHESLFRLFGVGCDPDFRALYQPLRPTLHPITRAWWDKQIAMFDPGSLKKTFYYHGTSGLAAWLMVHAALHTKPKVLELAKRLLNCTSLTEQRELYDHLEPMVWGRFSSWFVRQPALMTFLGVPRAQVNLIRDSHPGGLEFYIKDKLRHVMTKVPIWDNYFWRVYINGCYSRACCPEYLKAEHFEHLQLRVNRISTHTQSFSGFLREFPGEYSHFVLLDHQDWLAGHDPRALLEEWELILQNSRPGTRILMRSAAPKVDFIPPQIRDRLTFATEKAAALHPKDRVGTYGCVQLAEVR
ncbi:MAG: BtaA family protein [Verrucomicrobiaceae bacterium]|nr:BtaA family protein [Verrucomicrobiaceae bacterium]